MPIRETYLKIKQFVYNKNKLTVYIGLHVDGAYRSFGVFTWKSYLCLSIQIVSENYSMIMVHEESYDHSLQKQDLHLKYCLLHIEIIILIVQENISSSAFYLMLCCLYLIWKLLFLLFIYDDLCRKCHCETMLNIIIVFPCKRLCFTRNFLFVLCSL